MRGGSRPYAQEANGSPARRHQKPQHPPQPQHSLHRVWRLLRLLRLFPERREPPGPVTFIFSVSVSSLFAAMDNFIDAAVEHFAHDHTEPETDLYRRLREETYRVMSSPQMQVGLIEGLFLKLLVRLIGARNILEIGMFTGYSTLMMAKPSWPMGVSSRAKSIRKPKRSRGAILPRALTGIKSRSGWDQRWRRLRRYPVRSILSLSTPTKSTIQTTTSRVSRWSDGAA